MGRNAIRLWVLLLLSISSLFPVAAFAKDDEQTDNSARAAAEALFQQAEKLLAKKQYAEACEKLDASSELDPGVGTFLYLGDCYEKLGKLANAWAAFEEAESLANARGESGRAKVAESRAAALLPRLTQLVVKVETEVPGLEVRREGTIIPKALWGSPVPIDAGDYTISATAPGYEAWHTQVQVTDEHEPISVSIPKLEPVAPPPEPAAAPPSQEPPQPAQKENPPARDGSSQRTIGLAVGSIGVLALVADGVFTLLAASKNSNSKDDCSPNNSNICNSKGVEERHDALNLAKIATVSGVAGGVVLASGAVIYFTAPSAEHGAPQGLMLTLGGHF